MKITLNLDDATMQRLREDAARRGISMSALVEAGIWRMLDERSAPDGESAGLPLLPSWRGGGELVDISNREKLYRAMEEVCESPGEDNSPSPST